MHSFITFYSNISVFHIYSHVKRAFSRAFSLTSDMNCVCVRPWRVIEVTQDRTPYTRFLDRVNRTPSALCSHSKEAPDIPRSISLTVCYREKTSKLSAQFKPQFKGLWLDDSLGFANKTKWTLLGAWGVLCLFPSLLCLHLFGRLGLTWVLAWTL